MLTEEQIKNLKNGDPIVVKGIFSEVYADGSIVMQIVQKHKDKIEHDFRFFDPYSVSLPSEHGTSVPTPKHDPTRLFKKGDKVRVVEWNGRKDSRNGMEATVLSNEHGCFVDIECMIKEVKAELTYPACLLELVTPVEELEPYNVVDAHTHWDVADKDMKTVVTYNKAFHPNAKAAAEAECARLNAEWRKEHADA